MGLYDYLRLRLRLTVTVWPETSEDGHSYGSMIMDLAPGKVLIDGPPIKSFGAISELMKPGVLVGVDFFCERGQVIFYPTVESYAKEQSAYWLDVPDTTEFEVIQRRKHVRVDITMPVGLDIPEGEEIMRPVKALSIDLSGGGIRLMTDEPLFSGQLVYVTLNLLPDHPGVTTQARVVYVKENEHATKPIELYVAAMAFEDIKPQDEAFLVRECFRRQAQLKHLH